MGLGIDLLQRQRTRFVLWRPQHVDPAPTLFIGPIPANPAAGLIGFREFPLQQDTQFPELWELEALSCGLAPGQVYLYWFKLRDALPYVPERRVLYCTDPFVQVVDRRFSAPAPPDPDGVPNGSPPGVILFRGGELRACDPDGFEILWPVDDSRARLPPNNAVVIYELPTRWVRAASTAGLGVGVGTFEDVLALIDPAAVSPTFGTIPALGPGRALLVELGVNALELLPPADSSDDLDWGYGTAHYLAADFNLGGGAPQRAPTASSDLVRLIATCHRLGLRFFADMVMAFARDNPYRHVGFHDFFIQWRPAGDPQRDPEQGQRDGFGGDLLRYRHELLGYHPVSGRRERLVPAREYMRVQMAHWLAQYRVDGLRLDSVNNVANEDFLQEFKDLARSLWRSSPHAVGLSSQQIEERFLVVGEDLSVPIGLVAGQRLDGLWNERFKHVARQVLLGRGFEGLSFEESVRVLIDCRRLGLADGAQAVNYLGSHDVGGPGHERIYDYFRARGVHDAERRVKLAFACLLTAVGIPMILAGDEFADQHDFDVLQEHGREKQVDPVNYARLGDDWRQRVFTCVSRLVHLRTRSAALARNETRFLHVDFDEGKRVLCWQRGSDDDPVVVVANFSDWGTPDAPGATYVVPGFPTAPPGRRWHEVTQDRDVPDEWAGREPLFPWEAKVYACPALS